MTRVVILLFSLASIVLAGCERRVTPQEDHEKPGEVSNLNTGADRENGAYCFFEVRHPTEVRASEAPDVQLALLRAMWKHYESGEIRLPPLSRFSITYYAEPCDRQIMEPIVLEFGMAVSISNYTRYKDEFVRARTSQGRINPYKERLKVTTPIIEYSFEDSAYCFFEMREAEEDRTLEASDVRRTILRAMDEKYEDEELFLQPLSVGRVIYYAESCRQEIVGPIILEYGMTVTQSSYTKYKEAYAAAVARAGGFEIDD